MSQLDFGLVSATGCVRDHNEDNYYFFGTKLEGEDAPPEGLMCHATTGQLLTMAIFDGMGGEAAGEVASDAAATALGNYIKSVKRWDEKNIRSAYAYMNKAVVEAGISVKAPSMGATAVMLAGSNGKAWISNLGDSPAMILEGAELHMLAKAHTDEALMRSLGVTHHKPGLTQYLGIDPNEMSIEPYVAPVELRPGQCLLLCSDGLTDMVSNADIVRVLMKEQAASQKAFDLKNLALEHGGKDNITVAVCNVLYEEDGSND